MERTFQNQLTWQEILRGIILYIVRKLWFVPFLAMAAVLALLLLTGWDIPIAIGGALFGMVLAEGILFVLLCLPFSPEKVATYRLHDEELEIVGSGGAVHRYPYRHMRVLREGDLFLLCFPGRAFSIVPARHLGPGQADFLVNARLGLHTPGRFAVVDEGEKSRERE